jgi:hypothetical protein
MTYLEVIFVICVGMAAVSTVVTLTCVIRMLGILKRREPEEFQRLGAPHVVMNNTPRTNLAIFTFLKDREYEALRDQTVIRAASTTRKMYVATFCLYAVFLAVLAIVWASI